MTSMLRNVGDMVLSYIPKNTQKKKEAAISYLFRSELLITFIVISPWMEKVDFNFY